MLYQPTAEEITATLQLARVKFPYLGSRLDAAGELLENTALNII
jgi:hypothetical protein